MAANPILVQNMQTSFQRKETDPKPFLLTNETSAYQGGSLVNGQYGGLANSLKKSVSLENGLVAGGLNVSLAGHQNGGRDLDDDPLNHQLNSQLSQFSSQFDAGQSVLLASSLSNSISNSFSSSNSTALPVPLSSSLSNYSQIAHYPTNSYSTGGQLNYQLNHLPGHLADGQYNATLFDQFQSNVSGWTGLNGLNNVNGLNNLNSLNNLNGLGSLSGSHLKTSLNSTAIQPTQLLAQEPPQHFLSYPLSLNAYNPQ